MSGTDHNPTVPTSLAAIGDGDLALFFAALPADEYDLIAVGPRTAYFARVGVANIWQTDENQVVIHTHPDAMTASECHARAMADLREQVEMAIALSDMLRTGGESPF